MKNCIKGISGIIIIVFVLMNNTYAQEESPQRITGENRYETAANIAQENHEKGIDVVILARGDSIEDEPQITDALGASLLSGSLEAPILLTEKDRLPEATKKGLDALEPSKIYVIGGEAAITKESLENIDIEMERIAGKNRYETALAIAREGDTGSEKAFLVSGERGADALAVGSVAYKKGYPILLTEHDQLRKSTKEAIIELGIEEVILIGGEQVIHSKVKEELQEINGLTLRRIAGKNRADTSVEIANDFWGEAPPILVNGDTLVDAVGAAAFQRPIIFARQNHVSERVRGHINRTPGLMIAGGTGAISSGVIEAVYAKPNYERTEEKVGYVTNDQEGNVLGVQKGNHLVQIKERGNKTTEIYSFEDRIRGIHVMRNGNYIVATDKNHWDPSQPSKVYLSEDEGESFRLINEISTGSALWWSIDSDSLGNIYVGEYGNRDPENGKRVWKTEDRGKSWEIAFEAPEKDGIHIHLVAVDPYTDDVWVTYGDDYEGMYRSKDQGATWEWIREAQSTAAIFTEDSIYWGEDTYRGIITRYNREDETFEEVLRARDEGFYGGPIYDMALGENGLIYVPMLKYTYHNHNPTVWVGRGNQWDVLKEMDVKEGQGGGFYHITNPDKNGDIFTRGYRFKDLDSWD
ncbi:cell wall-binding repeat-containing protein [Isachenkonia alkalipeptolytica]|uniref:Sortilin N-terminal domain-containing protein n=1 Tax=Isachenkonia alkalipeptolytica TaxID=2565777 RepID=A0AA43XLF7_9CLOT|nr:cell wall-binding repeat-containing protein [Isachenkonia alkalipeptolytica]NBG88877.1 hypothetical protein [Isachenkonia alkalipeptolytica]